MAISGFRITQLQIYGTPGRPYGPFQPGWSIPLSWSLKLAGFPLAEFDYRGNTQFCQVQDVGIQIVITVLDQNNNPVDISQAATTTIKFLYPDGTTKDFNANFYTDGTDGRLVYNTTTDDLSQAGLYQVQAKINMFGAPKSTSLGQLQVNGNIDEN